MNSTTTKPQNLASLMEVYKQHLIQTGDTKSIPPTQSALLRFTLPGWGGSTPKGNKLTIQETTIGIELLQQLPISKLADALDVQEQVFEQLGTDKRRRRQPRHYLGLAEKVFHEFWEE